jgi:hypothetical protein
MRTLSERADGHRLRALIVLLWRAGLRISERSPFTRVTLIDLAARSSSGVRYAEFGIGPVMPGRWLCRVCGDVDGLFWSGWG